MVNDQNPTQRVRRTSHSTNDFRRAIKAGRQTH